MNGALPSNSASSPDPSISEVSSAETAEVTRGDHHEASLAEAQDELRVLVAQRVPDILTNHATASPQCGVPASEEAIRAAATASLGSKPLGSARPPPIARPAGPEPGAAIRRDRLEDVAIDRAINVGRRAAEQQPRIVGARHRKPHTHQGVNPAVGAGLAIGRPRQAQRTQVADGDRSVLGRARDEAVTSWDTSLVDSPHRCPSGAPESRAHDPGLWQGMATSSRRCGTSTCNTPDTRRSTSAPDCPSSGARDRFGCVRRGDLCGGTAGEGKRRSGGESRERGNDLPDHRREGASPRRHRSVRLGGGRTPRGRGLLP